MFSLVRTREASMTMKQLESNARKCGYMGKQAGLLKRIDKTLALLRSNPRHPGLRTHGIKHLAKRSEITGKVFESYVQNDSPSAYRVLWRYGPERRRITILMIMPHP